MESAHPPPVDLAPSSASPVLLLSGPAGAGKTTVADTWARRQPQPTLHLSLDDLRDRVKAGYVNPEDGATPEMFRQLALARTGCALLAKLYVAHGFRCIIDDAIFPAWPPADLAPWTEALRPLRPLVVVLLPSFESLVRRNRNRTGHRRLRRQTLAQIYDLMLPWREMGVTIIDNSDLSLDQTVQRLDLLVAQHEDLRHGPDAASQAQNSR